MTPLPVVVGSFLRGRNCAVCKSVSGVQRIKKLGNKKGQPRPPLDANVIRSYFVTVVVVGQ